MLGRRACCSSASLIAPAGIVPGRNLGAATKTRWPVPPQVRRVPETVGNFGRTRVDDYAWLKAKDWWGAIKLRADGSLGSRTATFCEPYTDAHDVHGNG